MSVRLLIGDARERLAELRSGSVQCCVTSPPYFGLRDYGMAGQIGLEETPDAFVEALVGVFREVRRVLRDDGTLWLNLGDSYANTGNKDTSNVGGFTGERIRAGAKGIMDSRPRRIPAGLKPKDLIGIPWRVAFALQADGWWLRQDIIWSKPNPMPESVTDRCTKAHEYLFLLSKSATYHYDADAIADDAVTAGGRAGYAGYSARAESMGRAPSGNEKPRMEVVNGDTRNRRSVWTVATQPFSEAHFATFPPDLIEPAILAGTSERGCCAKCGSPWTRDVERTPMVLDRSERTHDRGQARASGTMLSPPSTRTLGWSPSCNCSERQTVPCTVLDCFGGAGTTGLVADRLGRNAILIELNPTYAAMAERRVSADAGMFADVTAEAAA